MVHFAWMLGLHFFFLRTNGFSIEPRTVKLLAGEQKATEYIHRPIEAWGCASLAATTALAACLTHLGRVGERRTRRKQGQF